MLEIRLFSEKWVVHAIGCNPFPGTKTIVFPHSFYDSFYRFYIYGHAIRSVNCKIELVQAQEHAYIAGGIVDYALNL
jgi:hypothetical protein